MSLAEFTDRPRAAVGGVRYLFNGGLDDCCQLNLEIEKVSNRFVLHECPPLALTIRDVARAVEPACGQSPALPAPRPLAYPGDVAGSAKPNLRERNDRQPRQLANRKPYQGYP